MIRLSLLSVFAFTCLGCAPVTLFHGPFVSVGSEFNEYRRVGRRVEASSCVMVLFPGIPLVNASLGKAYDRAMAKSPDEATGLSAVNFSRKHYVGFAAYVECYEVSGVPAVLTLTD